MYDPHDDMDFPDSADLPLAPDDDRPMTPEDSDTDEGLYNRIA